MRKAVLLVATMVVLVLALSGVALAASPQDIYNDYAQDQKLDGTYTKAELQAYLGDAGVRQYGNASVLAALDAVVKGLLSSGNYKDADPGDRDTFPFTGAEVLLMALGGSALAGGGAVIRRLTRKRA